MAGSPKVTMALYVYNQEPYVAEAIESILAQDLDSFEIVLSDDCSEDGTFAVMERMAARHGTRQTIKLNRNPRRLGIGGQLNSLCRLASTDLIVLCGGDDRSRPQRARRCFERWSADPEHIHSVTSSAAIIDTAGQLTGERLPGKAPSLGLAEGVANRYHGVYGATQALTKSVWARFGDFHPRLLLEDNAILLRADLLGKYVHIDEDLVEYRVHANNSCRLPQDGVDYDTFLEKMRWYHRESALVNVQFLYDLYAPEAESHAAGVLERARHLAGYRMAGHQLDLEHYNRTFRASEFEHYAALTDLFFRAIKASIKSRLRSIDRRNAERAIRLRSQSSY